MPFSEGILKRDIPLGIRFLHKDTGFFFRNHLDLYNLPY